MGYNTLRPTEYFLTLKSWKEADIATEYGDGTEFREGQTVIHDYSRGRYRKMVEGTTEA